MKKFNVYPLILFSEDDRFILRFVPEFNLAEYDKRYQFPLSKKLVYRMNMREYGDLYEFNVSYDITDVDIFYFYKRCSKLCELIRDAFDEYFLYKNIFRGNCILGVLNYIYENFNHEQREYLFYWMIDNESYSSVIEYLFMKPDCYFEKVKSYSCVDEKSCPLCDDDYLPF